MSRSPNMQGRKHCGSHYNDAKRIRAFAVAHPDVPPKRIVEALHLTISRECVRQILINNLYRDDSWTAPKFSWRKSNPEHYRRLKLRPVVDAYGTVDLRLEGRRPAYDFAFNCPVCGMGYDTLAETTECCAAINNRGPNRSTCETEGRRSA